MPAVISIPPKKIRSVITGVFFGYAFLLVSCGEQKPTTLFSLLPADETGISFSNTIVENDSSNILDYEYTFNGGGIAVADFNNDGLDDLYFTANMGSNALYLNKGGLMFADVTKISGTDGAGRWCNGVSAVDINNDGWLDLYVCASRYNDPEKRKNLLYVNQGMNAGDGDGASAVPVFKEMAEAYGLADTSFSTQAAFFDYDNDGDLDMYLLVADKMQSGYQPNSYKKKVTDGSSAGRDRMYRNDRGKYVEVGKDAGILLDGFGLGVTITDINRDGWKDIYVSNDYLSNDLLWINEGNGHFFNAAPASFKHTSYSAMGNDVQDINNDGLADIVTLDMLSKDNYRKKTMSTPGNYTNYIYNDFYEYDYQFVRNTLQLNQGCKWRNDSAMPGAVDMRKLQQKNAPGKTLPVFSEIAFLAGTAETDWSWTPLLADFDNDGWRDLIVSNGFARDLSDRDFLAYRPMANSLLPKKELLEQIPTVRIADYAFRNKGGSGVLGFADVSKDWGMGAGAYSNGAVYADLDNDGDLDCVMNTINEPALVYRNNLSGAPIEGGTGSDSATAIAKSHWLQLIFEGGAGNRNGYGVIVEAYYGSARQLLEFNPVRGYLSSLSMLSHMGMGKVRLIDSLRVSWPGGAVQLLKNVKTDQRLRLKWTDAQLARSVADTINQFSYPQGVPMVPLLQEISRQVGLNIISPEKDFIDFNMQRLLPHKLSQYGPALAVADIDGNGTDDVFVGGAKGFSGKILLQDKQGLFKTRGFLAGPSEDNKMTEDEGVLLFDADEDGDQDLYIVSGGVESVRGSHDYQDRFYVNNGKGHFRLDTAAIPALIDGGFFVSGMAVKAADIDNDGDLDLLRTGRVDPGQYPLPVTSFILLNNSKDGKAHFNLLPQPVLEKAGMVSDGLFTDFDNDGWIDLILCREWQSPMVLKNVEGRLTDITAGSGIAAATGWWNSVTGGDFDNDGDIDYVLGNSGTNTLYQADSAHPAGIYAKDFNKDGRFDAVPSAYYADSLGQLKEYPAFGRDEMVEQLIGLRRRFPYYRDFARVEMSGLFSSAEMESALKYQVRHTQSSYMENKGGGRFALSALPVEAQFAPLFAMLPMDLNADGNLDLLINGNDYGMDLNTGRCDALNGLVLMGNGAGRFAALPFTKSGLYIPGDGRALVSLRAVTGTSLVLSSENKGPLRLFKLGAADNYQPVPAGTRFALLNLKNGKTRRQEIYYGSSFLSQSAIGLMVTEVVDKVETH